MWIKVFTGIILCSKKRKCKVQSCQRGSICQDANLLLPSYPMADTFCISAEPRVVLCLPGQEGAASLPSATKLVLPSSLQSHIHLPQISIHHHHLPQISIQSSVPGHSLFQKKKKKKKAFTFYRRRRGWGERWREWDGRDGRKRDMEGGRGTDRQAGR